MSKALLEVSVTTAVELLTAMQFYLTQTMFTFVLVGLVRGQVVKFNAPDNRGTEFIIGYMENLGQDIDVELFVTTMRRANVSVDITAPHFESAEIHHRFNVSYGMVKQVHFHNDIRVVGSSIDTKGVLVKSNDEIVIYGVNKEKFSCDAFLGLPVDVLGTDYYILTYYPPSDQCELLIVGVENNTAVTVRLGEALGNYTVRWDRYYYRKGDEIHISLDRLDTFQLVSKGDLSGSRVTSDKPVSVFSGNKKTKIGRGFSSDHIVEHLMPVTSWGKKFVTVPIPRRTVGDFFRFVASEDNTEIHITGGYLDTIIIEKAGDVAQQNIPSHAYCLVTANKAIFVAQFVQSQTSRFEPSDPSMIIIPPVEQFASDYTFATPKYSFGSFLNYFLFIVKSKDRSGLRLNGKPFPSNVRFTQISGTEYVGGYISIPEGSHNVRHVSPICIFGGYLYGRATMESYGFPTGMRMAPINTPCEPTPSVVGDGLDNDCDGLIDEELCVLDQKDNDADGRKNEDCAMPAPVDGNWSKWQSWEPCSATCRRKGHPTPRGSRTRRRTCTNPAPAFDGDICVGNDAKTSSCQPTIFCPIDGQWSDWIEWSHCSISCKNTGEDVGTTSRHRNCSNPPSQYGGKQCEGPTSETKECTPSKFCPVDGNWGSWGEWTACSVTCLKSGFKTNGVQTRNRSCVNPKPEHGGKDCPGKDEDMKECSPTNPCPVDGNWGSWGGWTACSVTCVKSGLKTNGVQTRNRSCVNPKPEHDGKYCLGEDEDIKECFPTNPCPVDGNWASWGEWTACSVPCLKSGFIARGVQIRNRSCVRPKPEHGGKYCPGEEENMKKCFPTSPCPVDGNWGSWGEWTACSVTCVKSGFIKNGVQIRIRSCVNPKPEHGGKDCPGKDEDMKECSPTNPCPVNGNWGSWGDWTACSETCLKSGIMKNGVQIRDRLCVNPKPEHGGKDCPGEDEDIKECTPTNPCPDLSETDWSTWSTCSVECGGGTRRRHRLCDSQLEPSCPEDIVQEDTCNTRECVGTMIELVTKQQNPPHFTYTKLTDYGFQPDADNSIVFHVKACNDAHVALISNDQRMYEVIIGGWSNTKSVIRTSKDGKPKASHNGALLNCSKFKTFHISWDDGLIVLHRNTSEGWVKVIKWQDPSPKTITNIAFTTGLWATGAWRFRGLATCNCLVSGDPHYTTFDGEQIDFMGTCKYLLSEYKKFGDPCEYTVEVKNEQRGSNSKVSYTRLVDVKMFGKVIRLHQQKNVFIDGELTYLPYHSARFQVVLSGTYVRFASKCGLVVEFDGESNAWVRVPSHFGDSFTGICGNCNGLRDDRHDVEVYQVKDDSDLILQHCITDTNFNPCRPEVRKEAETDSICKFLNPANADISPFRTCIGKNPDDARIKFESCVYDFCVYRQEANVSFTSKLCENIAAFADACLLNGYRTKWRSANFCPLQCDDHAFYNAESSACPSTCIDPKASQKCTLGTLESCECDNGYLLSNRKCVKASECGCTDGNGKYYPIGATFSTDCSTVKQCKVEGEYIRIVVVSKHAACGENTECLEKNGKHSCTCKRGYQGNPIKSCHPIYECRDDVTGAAYQGTVSQTVNENDCLPWNTSNSIFKYIGGHNFCRNPNADERQSPWCYVQEGQVTNWEYCDISMCHEEKPVCEASSEIPCSSSGNTFKLCHVEDARYITFIGLTRQTSTADCKSGFSFGRSGNSLWTDHGCGGYFEICFTRRTSVYNTAAPSNTGCKQTQSGTDYKGNWGRTVSGRVCQRWTSQYPHLNNYSTLLSGEVNYCRNPGSNAYSHTQPWCYTTDEHVTWEYCSIPNC